MNKKPTLSPLQQPIESKKKTWEEIVAESKELQFVPDVFLADAEKINELREDLASEIKRLSEKEVTLNYKIQEIFYKLRKHYEKNGMDDIWTKNINFEANALKEGRLIVVITEQQK